MKKRTKRIILVCMIGLLGVLGYAGVQLSDQGMPLKAEPSQKTNEEAMGETTIDSKDKDYKYTIPKDATKKEESTMPEGFVQSAGFKYNFSKRQINHYMISDPTHGDLASYYYGDIEMGNTDKDSLRQIYGHSTNGGVTGVQMLQTRLLNTEIEDSIVYKFASQGSGNWAGPKKIIKRTDNLYWTPASISQVNKIYNDVYYPNGNPPGPGGSPVSSKNLSPGSEGIGFPPQGGYYSETENIFYLNGFGYDGKLGSNPDKIINYKIDGSTGNFIGSEKKTVPTWNNIFTFPVLESSGIKEWSGGFSYPVEGIARETYDGGTISPVFYQSRDGHYQVQQFVIIKWNKEREVDFYIPLGDEPYNWNMDVPIKISTNETYYYFQNRAKDTDSKLKKVDMKKFAGKGKVDKDKVTTVKTYPKGTAFQITKLNDKSGNYFFYGYLPKVEGEFASFIKKEGIVIGQMNSEFDVINAQSLGADGRVNFSKFDVKPLEKDGSGGYVDVGGDSTAPSFTGSTAGKQVAFWGKLNLIENYAPGIKMTDNIVKNIDELNANSTWDKALLEGVEVNDVYDLWDKNENKQTQEWLNNRINRNPLDPNINKTDNSKRMPIDWAALGLDKTNAGPQKIKYFITDSAMQATASSRWLNKLTDQTIKEKNYAFDAQNFAIELGKVGTDLGTSNAFKKLAKTMAWDMNSHVIDEDGAKDTVSDTKVTINQDQLTALREAKVAKPYPVDVTYKPDASTTIVNRVWVFVTTKNTVIDKDKRVVIYANDYSLPLRFASQETNQKVYDHTDVKVYDYHDATHETDATLEAGQLPTIADKGKNQGALGVENLTVITGAVTAGKVIPVVTHTGVFGEAKAPVDVELTAEQVFHLRQVVVSEKQEELDQLVIPKTGHLAVKNSATQVTNIIVPSGLETETPAFEEVSIGLDTGNNHNTLEIKTIVPEYYSYAGYVLTDTDSPHVFDNRTKTGNPQTNITTNKYHFWVTVYLTPNLGEEGIARPYSWDAKVNDFGKIVP